jgi:cell fate regulator YaaT (PSP1 superfamily)
MPGCHLVRVGSVGHVGRFVAVDSSRYPRRSRVIVRTSRGLEIGEVLTPPPDLSRSDEPDAEIDGRILRGMTDSDELLSSRLNQHREKAFEACRRAVCESGLGVTLLDVEHLFDGRGLYFYFIGTVTPEVEQLTQQLAEIYDAQAQFRRFAQTLSEGCGPDCGTEAAAGGKCDSCTACAVAVACGRGG